MTIGNTGSKTIHKHESKACVRCEDYLTKIRREHLSDGQITLKNSLMVSSVEIGMRDKSSGLIICPSWFCFVSLSPRVRARPWPRRRAPVPVHRLPQVLHAEVRAQFARKDTYGLVAHIYYFSSILSVRVEGVSITHTSHLASCFVPIFPLPA